MIFRKNDVARGVATKAVLRVLDGERQAVPPVWMMRQAGRYLPEYRRVRAEAGSFLNLCFTPKLAAEVTLQPIRRFHFDAAILFSDILVVPHALGQNVSFETGEGPRLDPIADARGIERLRAAMDAAVVAPVLEAIHRVKEELPPDVALLGFCGAPWTVATYMIAGRGTDDQRPARLFAYGDPDGFACLMDRLVEASTEYLVAQLEAGVDAVQIFDTWASVLPPEEFSRWCVAPVRDMVARVRARVPEAKIIGFPRGAGTLLPAYVDQVAVDAVGLDWMIDREVGRIIQQRRAVQGNLDPLALVAGGEALDRAVDAVLAAFAERPFIFNLGHGIVPETPVEHVERMLARIRARPAA